MIGEIKNLEIKNVVCGESTAKARVQNRQTHMLLYKVNGESVYYLRERQMRILPGCVLFIPEGESYRFEKTCDEESEYYLVNFCADFADDLSPKLFSLGKNEKIAKVFRDMEQKSSGFCDISEKYELISLFYHLLSMLASGEKSAYFTSEQRDKIEPAVQYLSEHIFDPDLKIPSLSMLCGVSDVTFRHLFNLRFGVSPRKYIIRNRLFMAKSMLEKGKYDSIAAVAEAVGYTDRLYFSKHFKSFFGASPSSVHKERV